MTIPTLMNNTNKQEYVSRLLKTYSTLGQGLNSIWNNNDTAPGDYEFFSTHNFIDEFAKVASIEKKCNSILECTGSNIYDNHRWLNGNSISSGVITSGKTVIMTDGQMISYIAVSGSSNVFLSAENTENTMGRFVVDVNGNKGPNKIGVDTYYFYLVRGNGIVPAGMDGVTRCAKNQQGQDCAAKVLKEKAINYI